MTAKLDVYLHADLTGQLIMDEYGQTLFEYSQTWLTNDNAIPISLSLPLQTESFGEKQCKPFFAGVLPDSTKRTLIARNLGISANNDFAMLKEIGGECAGAITFLNTGEKLSQHQGSYKALPVHQLESILTQLPTRPLLAGEHGVRLSIAGAQDKIAVYKNKSELMLPLDNAPSSHILKPDIEAYKGIIFNEAFCMNLAAAIGLHVAPVIIGSAGVIDYLLIERYDRTINFENDKPVTHRIHQEDFCQALGVIPERKYHIEGGPSVKDCFDLIRKVSSVPVVDLMRLLDAIIYNFLIGNHDAHGKNFSLFYRQSNASSELGKVRLAPLYDLICTAVYPNITTKLAMKIGDAYSLDEVDTKQFEKLADQIAFSKPLVKRRIIDQAKKVLDHLPQLDKTHPSTSAVQKFISDHCENVLKWV